MTLPVSNFIDMSTEIRCTKTVCGWVDLGHNEVIEDVFRQNFPFEIRKFTKGLAVFNVKWGTVIWNNWQFGVRGSGWRLKEQVKLFN